MIYQLKIVIFYWKCQKPYQITLLKISHGIFILKIGFWVVKNIKFSIFRFIDKLSPTDLRVELIDIWWLLIKILDISLQFESFVTDLFMDQFFAIMIQNIDIQFLFCILIFVSHFRKYTWIFWSWMWLLNWALRLLQPVSIRHIVWNGIPITKMKHQMWLIWPEFEGKKLLLPSFWLLLTINDRYESHT